MSTTTTYLTAVVSTREVAASPTMREVRVRFAGDTESIFAGLIRHTRKGEWEAEGLIYGHECGAANHVARIALRDLGWCSCEVVARWHKDAPIAPHVMRDIARGHADDTRDGITPCRSRH